MQFFLDSLIKTRELSSVFKYGNLGYGFFNGTVAFLVNIRNTAL